MSSTEVGEYKGFLYLMVKSEYSVSYMFNEVTYLRFYELCAAIDSVLEGEKVFRIYYRKTDKLLAIYNNPKTLETLDMNKCYYIDSSDLDEVKSEKVVVGKTSRSHEKRACSRRSDSSANWVSSGDSYHSGGYGGSHSSSSSDSSSSSSCDSSSF